MHLIFQSLAWLTYAFVVPGATALPPVSDTELIVSVSPASPLPADVVAAGGPNNNQFDHLVVLAPTITASQGTVIMDELPIQVDSDSQDLAVVTALYAYDQNGSLVASASVGSKGTAVFTGMRYIIAASTTKTFVIKADIRNASYRMTSFKFSVVTKGIKAHGIRNQPAVVSGSAANGPFVVANVGPIVTLSSVTIDPSRSATGTTLTATFNLLIQAVGGDIYVGWQRPLEDIAFDVYKDGAPVSVDQKLVLWNPPLVGAVTTGINSGTAFKLVQNNTVTLRVSVTFDAAGQGSYAVGLNSIRWSAFDGVFNNPGFEAHYWGARTVAGQMAWRTAAIAVQ